MKKFKIAISLITTTTLILFSSYGFSWTRSYTGGFSGTSRRSSRGISGSSLNWNNRGSIGAGSINKRRARLDNLRRLGNSMGRNNGSTGVNKRRRPTRQAYSGEEPLIVLAVDNIQRPGFRRAVERESGTINKTHLIASAFAFRCYPDTPSSNAIDGNLETEWVSFNGTEHFNYLSLQFEGYESMHKIVLYDRSDLTHQITDSRLEFGDGSTIEVGELPNDGSPKEIYFPPKRVRTIRFRVLNTDSGLDNIGLAEIEVWGPERREYVTNVRSTFFREMQDEFIEYAKAIAKDTPARVIIHPMETINTASGLHGYLSLYYGRNHEPEYRDIVIDSSGEIVPREEWVRESNLVGAILIGDIPIEYHQSEEHGEYPNDLFYMDFDSDMPRGDRGAEIWVSRIPTHSLHRTEEKMDLMINYMRRNIEFRERIKQGEHLTGKALKWSDEMNANNETPMMYLLYNPSKVDDVRYYPVNFGHDNVVDRRNIQPLTELEDRTVKEDLIDRITRRPEGMSYMQEQPEKYDLLDLSADCEDATTIKLTDFFRDKGETITSEELFQMIPHPKFYILRVPGALNYSVRDYIGGILLFGSASNGLVAVGNSICNKEAMCWQADHNRLYYNLAGRGQRIEISWGEAFKRMLNVITDVKDNRCDSFTASCEDFPIEEKGFILLGDGSLVMSKILDDFAKGNNEYVENNVIEGIVGGKGEDLSVTNIYFDKIEKNGEERIQLSFKVRYRSPECVDIEVKSNGEISNDRKDSRVQYIYYRINIDGARGFGLTSINEWEEIITTNFTIPIDEREHTIRVMIDATNRIREYNENNNSLEENFWSGESVDPAVSKIRLVYTDNFINAGKLWGWRNSKHHLEARIANNGVIGNYVEEYGDTVFDPIFRVGIWHEKAQDLAGDYTKEFINVPYSALSQERTEHDNLNGTFIALDPKEIIEALNIEDSEPKGTYSISVLLDSGFSEYGNNPEDNNMLRRRIELPF